MGDPRETETQLANKMIVTSMNGQQVRLITDIPYDPADLTIVDLAAGASGLTANLLRSGVDAHAVDWVYDKPDLEDRIESDLQESLRRAPPFIGELTEQTDRITIAEFFASFRQNRTKYHTAWLTDLPFPDRYADIVVSTLGITHIDSAEIQWAATMEAMRVTKPGGRLVFYPFHIPDNPIYRYYADVDRILYERLNNKSFGAVSIENVAELPAFRSERFGPLLGSRMVIKKNP